MKRPIAVPIVLPAITALLIITSCETNNNDPIDPGTSTTELLSKRVSDPPLIDGIIDAIWDESQVLLTETVVPSVDFDNFQGYVGDGTEVQIRSMYDDTFIYFLAEWKDGKQDASRETWYFDPADKKWKQESRYPQFDQDGNKIREPFYEDKFAILYNIDNSVVGWNTASCYASCHSVPEEQKVRHYTREGEFIDMWHWKSVRTEPNGQIDDQYQSYVEGGGNGRHSDDKMSGGYSNNIQTLTVTGTSEDVTVPLYYIPERGSYFWITEEEIDNFVAKKITAVDSDGVLSVEGGGIINPNTENKYQRDGEAVGIFGIPSIYTAKLSGSRGDISSSASYTGEGWILEFKRKLTVDSSIGENGDKQDVDFGSLEDQVFGIGVFDNAAIAHSIKPGLLLRFEE